MLLSTENLTEIANLWGKGKGAISEDNPLCQQRKWFQTNLEINFLRKRGLTLDECHRYMLGVWGGGKHENPIEWSDMWWKLNDRVDEWLYREFHDELHEAIVAASAPPKQHAGHELGPREFTLTYSPDWFDDDRAAFMMKRAIERLCEYYDTDIIYLKAVGERTQAGRVHIHCMYELKGGLKMTDKNMKRAYPNWNGKVHHHKLIASVSNFKGYIEKDLDTAWFKHIVDNRTTAQGEGT